MANEQWQLSVAGGLLTIRVFRIIDIKIVLILATSMHPLQASTIRWHIWPYSNCQITASIQEKFPIRNYKLIVNNANKGIKLLS